MNALEALGVGFEIKRPAQLPEYQSPFLGKCFGAPSERACYQRYLGRDSVCRPCLLARAVKTGEIQREKLRGVDGRHFDVTAIPLPKLDQVSGWAMEVLQDVTERSRAEQALRESEERFRAMAENTLDVIARFDRQYRCLYVNPVVAKQTGALRESFEGKTLAEMSFPPGIRRAMEAEIDAVFATAETRRTQLQWPNGYCVDMLLIAERGEAGETRAVITSARDITYLKRTEEELRQREARLEQAQSLANVGDFVWDFSAHEVTWSRQLCRIHGVDLNDLSRPENAFWHLIVPGDRERVAQHLATARIDGEPVHVEYRIVRPDGVERSLAATISVQHGAPGEPAVLSGSVQDITDQVLAASALRASEERYRMLADNVGDGIWLMSLKTLRLVYASQAVVRALGYSLEELNNISLDQLMTPESYARMRGMLAEALPLATTDRDIMRRIEVEERMKSGDTRWVEVTARLLFDAHGAPSEIIGVTHDISERRRAHELMAQAKAHAEEASRLKSQFVSNVSHEVRTPLNAIIGLAELMLRDGDLASVQARARIVLNESEVLLALVNELLDHAKMEEGKLELCPESIDLRGLLTAIGRSTAIAAARKALAFRLAVASDVPEVVVCDELRLRQVLQNLTSNAVKFTSRGEVALEVSCLGHSQSGVLLRFSVIDTGVGIPADRLTAIFDAFVQADANTTRRFGGTGLGTTIARQLVRMMGGELKVASSPDQGSRFWFDVRFELGASATLEPPSSRGEASSSEALARKGKILVAEDYPINHRILREHLESVGHEVTVVENGEDAFRACAEQSFDLVFMDLQMPVMDGFESARRIRQLPGPNGRVPILATTASAEASTRRECVAKGMNGVITKPVRRRIVLETVDNWLLHSAGELDTPMPPSMAIALQHLEPKSQEKALDFPRLLEQFGGKESLARSVAQEFARNLKREQAEMASLCRASEFEELRRRAHRVKGGAASISATAVAGIAEQLESAARNADIVSIAGLLVKLAEAQCSLARLLTEKPPRK